MSRLIEKYITDLFNDKKVSEKNKQILWKHYYDKLSNAVDVGWNDGFQIDDKELVKSLKNSIAEFSAFKETSFRKDLEELLTKDGKLTPKNEFLKEAYKVSGDYNTRWLETEYHETIAGANMAAKMKDYEQNLDLYPNLKLVSVRDARVRPEHKALDGTIRPFNDPFWNDHTPPLDWGCRCDLEQTDEEVTEVKGGIQTKIEFANNPAKTGKIFGGSAYEEKLSKNEKKEAEKNSNKWLSNEIYTLPREQQFEELYRTTKGKLSQHINITKGDDYEELVEIGKLFAKTNNSVELMPEIYKSLKTERDLIFPLLQSQTSNPDLKIGELFYDLKRPKAIKNIVGNANDASKQGAIAIISDSHLDKELTDKIMKERAKDIFGDKNYKFDQVYFYRNKTLEVFNRTGD